MSEDASGRTDPAALGTKVLIGVPFYKNEQLVAECLGGLLACAADLRAIGAEVVCYNDSPGYAPLAAALDAFVRRIDGAFAIRVAPNATNLGFVKTMNQAVTEAVTRKLDLVMLNSDATVTPGALPEMIAVAALDYMTAFVTPRSNNATLATLPLQAWQRGADAAAYLRAQQALVALLPRVSVVPTGVGFCMLIRWRILAEFGGFDEIYGHGYNEENDLVMRVSRCGYRAVMANRAFVWHEGEASIASTTTDRNSWERTNRAILDSRYPEYGSYTSAYFQAPETLAEDLIAALVPGEDGKLDLAFDFSSFRAAHNGTFQAGYQILRHAAAVWGERFRLHVICATDVYAFHDYAALGIARADPHDKRRYAAIFRVGQPYDWNVIERLVVMGAVIGIYMLDTISIDCPQLTSTKLYNIWQFALDQFDFLVTQSAHTQTQFNRRFTLAAGKPSVVALHSLDLADYVFPAAISPASAVRPRFVIIGNHFHHKYLAPTANTLAAALPDCDFIAVGLAAPTGRGDHGGAGAAKLAVRDNLQGVPVGELTDEELGALYGGATAVVFPSHAEGFGFPALNALAAHKPVFLRRLPVFLELWEKLGRTTNFHFYDTTAELIERLRLPVTWVENQTPEHEHGSLRAALEIRDAIDAGLRHADYHRIAARIRAVQFIADMGTSGPIPQPQEDRIAQVARLLSSRVERYVRVALQNRVVFFTSRLAFRGARRVVRLVRRR